MKSDKIPYIFDADIESLGEKTDGLANNPEHSSTTNITEHIPCGFFMLIISVFDNIENKHLLIVGKDCMEKFTSLREHAINIINFEKNKLLPLTKE